MLSSSDYSVESEKAQRKLMIHRASANYEMRMVKLFPTKSGSILTLLVNPDKIEEKRLHRRLITLQMLGF